MLMIKDTENADNKQTRFNRTDTAAIAVSAITVVLNVVSFFFLPGKLVTGISFSGDSVLTDSLMYVIIASCIVALCGVMCVTNASRKKKWFSLCVVTAVANVICLVINLTGSV